jgi:Trk-type K+ transport system membrane component
MNTIISLLIIFGGIFFFILDTMMFEMKESNVVIKDVKCRYPNDVVWSKGKSGRGTVVKLN